MVIILPTLFKYSFPSQDSMSYRLTPRSSRHLAMAAEQENLYHWAEDVFSKLGLPPRECLQFFICKVAQEGYTDNFGLLGRVLQATFLIDPIIDTTENMMGYINAKVVGEENGDCEAEYHACHVDSLGEEANLNVILKNIIHYNML